MKRLFVILLILCTWVTYPMLHAQIYTTSSATYHSYSVGGYENRANTCQFRTTSPQIQQNHTNTYSTAPMRVATGTVSTVASQLQGGISADEFARKQYITRAKKAGPSSGGPPPPDTSDDGGTGGDTPMPIGEGWDVALLLLILCIGYALYLRRKSLQQQSSIKP